MDIWPFLIGVQNVDSNVATNQYNHVQQYPIERLSLGRRIRLWLMNQMMLLENQRSLSQLALQFLGL